MTIRKAFQSKIMNLEFVNKSLYKIKFERNSFEFLPGQHISLGLNGIGSREYSIASGTDNNYFEVIVRKIVNGCVSPALSNLKHGDYIDVGSPVGYFSLPESFIGNKNKKIYLIATGTGIAPFRCFSHSYLNNSFTILHGISDKADNMKNELHENSKYIICSKKIAGSDYNGRVTDYLNNNIEVYK